jgi:hypothetical protein
MEDAMKALSIAAIVVILPALSLQALAETMHLSDGFVTTSGNIQCGQSDPAGSLSSYRVYCVRFKPNELMAYIENGHVKVSDQNIPVSAVEDQGTLRDGDSNVFAKTTCTVAKDGVTCIDNGTSFKISRRGVETLKQVANP